MNKKLIIVFGFTILAGCASRQPSSNSAPDSSASKPVEQTQTAGNRREVKGINDWSGYIQGTPAAKSKFAKLTIGMGRREVMDLAGAPTDQSAHVTGKAWIPFYYGSGRFETMLYYKGVGRLLFAGNAGFTTDSGLIGIEHDTTERGYH